MEDVRIIDASRSPNSSKTSSHIKDLSEAKIISARNPAKQLSGVINEIKDREVRSILFNTLVQ